MKARKNNRILGNILSMMACSSTLYFSHAANIWDGGGTDANWNTAANWDDNVVPAANAVLTFTGVTRTTAANNTTADRQYNGLLFTNDGSTDKTAGFTLSTNRITLGGDIVTTANTTGSTITDTISLAMILNGNRVITTNQLSATVQHNLTVSGVISETGGARTLTKNGAGTLILSGSNSFTGSLDIAVGTLRVASAAAVGANGTIVSNSSTTNTVFAASGATALTFSRNFSTNTGGGAITFGDAVGTGDLTFTGNLTRATGATNRTVNVAGSTTVTFNGNLLSPGTPNATTTFTKGGTGTLVIRGTGSAADSGFSQMVVAGGTLSVTRLSNLGSASSLGTASAATPGAVSITLDDSTLRYISGGAAASTTNRVLQIGRTTAAAVGTIRNDATSAAETLTFSSTGAIAYGTINQTRSLVLRGTNTGPNTFAPAIGDNGTAAVSLTKQDTGTWLLSGANTYSGATSVSSGRLAVSGTGTLANTSGLSVSSGAIFGYFPSTIGSTLTMGAGSTLNFSAGSVLQLSWDSTSASNITALGAATLGNRTYLEMFGSFTTGTTYNLLNAASGLDTGSLILLNLTDYTVNLSRTATSVSITPTAAPALSTAYWKGSLTAGVAGVWAASDGISDSNWVAVNGGASQALVPGVGANVIVSDSSPLAAAVGTTLGSSMAINSLTISDIANGLGLNADGNTLTISPLLSTDGILMESAVPASSIAASVALGSDQTWTNNSVNTLTISGAVSGTFALTKAGTGTLSLGGTNSYSGGTTISSGTLVATAAGALGSGNVTNNGTLNLTAGTVTYTGLSNTNAGALSGNGTINVTLGTGGTDVPLDGDYSSFTGTWNVGVGAVAGANKVRMTRADNPATTINVLTHGGVYTGFAIADITHSASIVLNGGDTGESFGQLRMEAGHVWAGSITLAGAITGTGDAFLGNTSGTASTISGAIGETGGPKTLSKVSTGTMILTNPANSYSGGTAILSGPLVARGALGVLPAGPVTMGATASLQILNDASGTIAQGNNITLSAASTAGGIVVGNAGGTTTGSTVAFGALNNGTSANAFLSTFNFTANNGYLQTYTSLALSGSTGQNTTLNPTTTAVTILGNVTNQMTGFGAGNFDTLTLGGTSTGNAINGIISDASTFVSLANGGDTRLAKSNTSSWTLAGPNTYSGTTTLTAGILSITNGSALGAVTSGTTQSGASELRISGGITTLAEALSINGGGINNGGALRNFNDNNTFAGTVTLAAQSRINSDSGTLILSNTTAVAGAAQNLVVGGAGNVNIAGSIATTTGSVFKDGTGTLILSGGNSYSGSTSVNDGVLQLDYSGDNTSKLSDTSVLTLGNATLDLKGGSHTEIVGSTILSAGTASRVTTSTPGSVLQMGEITRNEGASINFSTSGIATTDTLNNAQGILGSWATIGGTSLAVNSTNAPGGLIVAATSTDVTRLTPGIIPDAPTTNIRIIEGAGSPGSITLAAPSTTINTLNQSSIGGASAAVIDPAGQTLGTNGILVGSGAGALTIGNGTNNGFLIAASAGGDLALNNSSTSGLTINSVIADNSFSTLTKIGAGSLVLNGDNLYSGGTTLGGGTLVLGNAGALGTGLFTILSGSLDSSVADLTLSNNNALALNSDFTFVGSQNLNVGTGVVTTNAARTVTVNQRNLTLGGAVTLGGNLIKAGNGTLTLNGAVGLSTNRLVSVTNGTLSHGGSLTATSTAGFGVFVGNAPNASSALIQTGGTVTISGADTSNILNVGNATTTAGGATGASGGFGSYTMAGGSLVAPRINIAGGDSGVNGTNSIGLFTVLTGATAKFNNFFIGGRNVASNTGVATIAGGALDLTSSTIATGTFGGGRFEVNLGANLGGSNTGGTFDATARNFSAVANAASSQGIVNLLGGTLTTNAITSPAGTSTGTGINQINLNGGTLKYSGAAANATFLAAIPAGAAGSSGVFVRSGGAFIDNNGQNITIAAALLAPTGGEISSIAVTGASAPGTFVTAPYVRIAGGNNDATAVARINDDGSLHSIVVTNPGSGYSVNPPVVTLVGGTNSGGTSTVTGSAVATVVDSTSGALTKTGANSLILSGANTYTGGTVISSGNIEATVSSAFGTGAVSVLTDARLIVNGNNVTIANDITLEGLSAAGAIYSGDRPAGNVTNFTGNITLEADSNISSWWNDKTLRLSGKITGSGGLDFIRQTNSVGGRFFITGLENDYSGETTVTGDTAPRGGYTGQAMLYLGADNALPVTSALTLNYADLYLNGQSQTLPSITGTGTFAVKNGSTFPASLTLGAGDASSTFAGSIEDNGIAVTNTSATPSTVTGTVSLKKTGTGTLTLTGINTYTGDTELQAGTLELADNARLKFVLGAASGINNSIFGAGNASLEGDFVIDTTAADTLESGTWLLENVTTLTGAYGTNFTVAGFTDAGSNKWTKTVGSKKYTFDETTGTLTMVTSGYALWADVNGAGVNLNDDHDNDGVANGVEYFLGGPSGNTTGFTALPGVTNTAGTLSVTWVMGGGYVGVYGTDFTVETSDTLTGTWNTETQGVTVTVTGSNVTYTFPTPLGTKKFARLKVTGP